MSPTTIATVLRSSGLGPAPRRIGPTWSEFLRAQAHSMLGGGLRESLHDDTFEPSDWAAGREARQVEADDNLTPADVAGPQLASQPLPVGSRQALPRQCVLPATRGPSRLQPSHRSHARDGPTSRWAACPTTQRSGASVRTSPLASRVRADTESDPLGSLPGSSTPTASVQPIDHRSELPVNRVSLPHTRDEQLPQRQTRAAGARWACSTSLPIKCSGPPASPAEGAGTERGRFGVESRDSRQPRGCPPLRPAPRW